MILTELYCRILDILKLVLKKAFYSSKKTNKFKNWNILKRTNKIRLNNIFSEVTIIFIHQYIDNNCRLRNLSKLEDLNLC